MSDNEMTPIHRAIKAAGGPGAVAAMFDINPVSVHEWVQKGRIPAERAPHVAAKAAEAGQLFRLEDLCPPVPWEVAHDHMDVVRDEQQAV